MLSEHYADHEMLDAFRGRLGERDRPRIRQALREWRRAKEHDLGPASSVRAIFDAGALPLVTALGLSLREISALEREDVLVAALAATGGTTVGLVTTPWGRPLHFCWRDAVNHAIRIDATWCLCFNGRQLRLVDAGRSYTRAFLEFDLDVAIDDDRTCAVLQGLLRAEAFAAGRDRPSLVEQILARSAEHAAGVCRALRDGVLEAVAELLRGMVVGASGRKRARPVRALLDDAFGESLTLVYRVLFLLFAEARGLVPAWHPIYRDSYTIESLRALVERPGRHPGVWAALVAISRLAHAGCRAGDLHVTAFNGRLFSPARTPIAESVSVDDRSASRALLALSTTPVRGAGRARITYRDLGVEQLGGVYETVLDYEPAIDEPIVTDKTSPARAVTLRSGGGHRKATGTFYTPLSVTDYLVRRTLSPLVADVRPDDVLRLRVLDPAMGSGAFLVAACRYLAGAYESALVRDGACHPTDIGDADRAGFRRTIAQQCLFGVDLNPMAVQLARLSIWLATLSADRPLTFLDHHLLAGDSLVGASLADIDRLPPGSAVRRSAARGLPLFDDDEVENGLSAVVPARLRVATEAGDTLGAVQAKEQALADLARPSTPLARWKQIADLWCAWWFWPPRERPPRTAFEELVSQVLRGRSALPRSMADRWLGESSAIAARQCFFHWTLEFPEVFFDAAGRPVANAGFDAILTNPPWDVMRADREHTARGDSAAGRLLVSFTRDSGTYRCQSGGHANLFQLFVERGVQLTRRGGRVGFVLPWGFASDHGCASLRRLLLDRCETDALVGMDNVNGIFPIHRSVRFLLLTATTARRTDRLACRFGETDPRRLDAMDDTPGSDPADLPVTLSRPLLERISGEGLAIPDLRTADDVLIFERVTDQFPALASPQGWQAHFARELNATDDRGHFTEGGDGLPVVEGKQIEPFIVHVDRSRLRVARNVAARLLDPAVSFLRPRLAYRDVASATNRLTLIAAMLPSGCVSTHTLFCLKTDLDERSQWVLCGVFNSYVANYLVRARVVTHVGVAIMDRLPVPRPPAGDLALAEIGDLAMGQAAGAGSSAALARLQALVARLYRMTPAEYAHVLDTFPLVDPGTRREAASAFAALTRDPEQRSGRKLR
jgi:hypothetical protein